MRGILEPKPQLLDRQNPLIEQCERVARRRARAAAPWRRYGSHIVRSDGRLHQRRKDMRLDAGGAQRGTRVRLHANDSRC